MAISATIATVATVGGMVAGNQAKQKAKGQAGQVERDAQAASDAADKKLQATHDQNILAQSQAAGVARAGLEATPARASTLISPNLNPPKASAGASPLPAPIAPVQRKTLLGQ